MDEGTCPHQFLAATLTLSQPGGTDYAHLITTGTPGFSDLPTALSTLESGIEVGPTVINLAFFSRPYGLIRDYIKVI